MNKITNGLNIFGQEIPRQELFHYTSMEGLKGVVEGKTLWATNIEFLNDSSEFRHGKEVLGRIIKTRKKSAKGDKKEFFNHLENYPTIFEAEDVFLVSLSEAGDLLSQWRGYAPIRGGYSIGFDPDALQQAAYDLEQMLLLRCVYDEEQQRESARQLLDDCLDSWAGRNEERQASKKAQTFYFSPILLFRIYATFMAASFKDATFAEEREWRLLGVCRDLRKFRFRTGASSLAPYIELTWGWDTKAPNTQPIASVTVGPCPNPDLSRKSVKRLLDANDAAGVWVKESKIPFRAW